MFNDSETLRTEASLCTCIGSFIALQGLALAFPLASSTTDDIISIFQDILAVTDLQHSCSMKDEWHPSSKCFAI